MKKTWMIAMIALVALVAVQGALLAKTVKGTVNKASVEAKKLDVATATGSLAVAYDEKTVWPMGVTDPKNLEGKLVNVTVDDITDVATSVREVVMPVVLPPLAPGAPDAPAAEAGFEEVIPVPAVAEEKKM